MQECFCEVGGTAYKHCATRAKSFVVCLERDGVPCPRTKAHRNLEGSNIQECAPVVGLIPPNASCECEEDLDSVYVCPIEEHEFVRLKRQHQDRSQPQHSVSGQYG